MAGREKKPALLKKQTAIPSKDGDVQVEGASEKAAPAKSNAPKLEAVTGNAAPPQLKLMKTKKTTKPKKNLKIKFKAKAKNAKKLKLSKSLFKNSKHLDAKNVTLVKNGLKRRGRKKTKKTPSTSENVENIQNDTDLPPPVLEPMTNLPEATTPKKEPKKRTKKQASEDVNDLLTLPIDPKKIKVEPEDKETVEDVLNDVANELQLDIDTLMKKPVKKKVGRKPGVKTPVAKPKKPPTPRKQKTETIKGKRAVKKEAIIETLSKDIKIDSDAQNVINKLDLNVTKTIKKQIVKKRRHSIEKFPPVEESQDNTNFESLFSNSRRSASPRSRRNAKIRQSLENPVSKRFSPYTTRSDSPARILRNGKHRKLKGTQLFDVIENEYKRRKRICSENEMSESDSNFSDMTSITENGIGEHTESIKDEGGMTKSDLLRKEILDSIKVPVPEVSELKNLNIKSISTKITSILKRSLSTETSQFTADSLQEDIKPKTEDLANSFTDTNSNDVKPIKSDFKDITVTSTPKDTKTEISCDSIKIKKEDFEDTDKIASSPSCKVPEKSFILDQMKQIFNDSNDKDGRLTKSAIKKTEVLTSEDNPETVPVNKFYGIEKEDKGKEDKRKEVKGKQDKGKEEPEEKILQTEIKPSEEKSCVEEAIKTETKSSEEEQNVNEILNESFEEEDLITLKIEESIEEGEITDGEKLEISIPETESSQDEVTDVSQPVSQETTEIEEQISIEEKTNDFLPEDLLSNLAENSAISISIIETTKEDPQEETKEDSQEETKEDPQVGDPQVENPQVEDPQVEDPQVEDPQVEDPQVEDPQVEDPQVEDPHVEDPQVENSQVEDSQEETQVEEPTSQIEEPPEKVQAEIEEMETDSTESQKAESEPVEPEAMEETQIPINQEDISQNDTQSSEEIKENKVEPIIETPENQAIKENILSALGLQSLKAAEEAKLKEKQKPIKNDGYTGTLKTVIKLNRNVEKKKKERNPLKMTLQKSKSRSSKDGDSDNAKNDGASGKNDGENACYKVMKETGSGWRHGSHSSDTAGANRKSHYSNRSNLDGSSEQTSDNDVPMAEGEATSDAKKLVIPEKASSFSIHPDRLCSDECAYCFGKFGLFDTPMHIAQIKSVERQDKILKNEIYLMRDSCLCDACYRHVDRRNTDGQCNNKAYKRSSTTSTVPKPNYCHVLGCEKESSNLLRRKWLIKMKKSVTKLINVDLDNPGLHSIPVCSDHYTSVEHLMVCALCKRRLARNHIHYLGSECEKLNSELQREGIPVTLTDKPVVCKPCRYFATLLLKPPASDSQSNTAEFFRSYKKRLLHFYDIEIMDDEAAEEPIILPSKEKQKDKEKSETKDKSEEPLKKKSKSKPSKSSKLNSSGGASNSGTQPAETEKTDQSRVPLNSENCESRASTPSDNVIDYEALVPNLSLESSDVEEKQNEVPKTLYRKLQIPESVREAVEISKIMKVNKKTNLVERLGSNPSISVRQLFQGEEDLPLQAHIDFTSPKERTPEGWERNVCTIQYDTDTKHLWQELQKPYGNQSSFLRHLILLEKYFRNGDLTLSPNASHHAVNYSVSVQNRLRAYDNIPSSSVPMQPLTMLPFNQVKKSTSGIITTREPSQNVVNAANLPKNTPISISQLNPNLLSQLSVRQKAPSVPPGLISLQPGTNRPVGPVKGAQKIKVPVGKNWKPTLIPVTTPGTAAERRLSGVVQVISGGKPYHISLQDYNKMCYLKRNQEIKKLAEPSRTKGETSISPSSILKPGIPRKQKAVTITAKPRDSSSNNSTPNTSLEIIKETSLSQEKKPVMILPKIPKSLTVIPQTVPRKPLQPTSPTLSITTKPSTSRS